MCTTKTDRQYNQTTTFSKKRFIGNAAVSQLVFAFLISLLALSPSAVFAQLFISATEGSTDYVIPANINAVDVTVKGGVGATISNGSCIATGGKGVVFTARFNVNNVICPAISLESGGMLRAIVGARGGGGAGGLEEGGVGGGGGSALLYKAPGSNDWIILVVAGGGGGGATRTLPCRVSNGGDGLLGQNGGNGLNSGGSGGANGNGGFAFLLDAFAGGGRFTDGTSASINPNCNGQTGFPSGGAGGDCGSNFISAGGFGFGSGGAGGLNGGGGGGYSGGGGGGPGAGGGGGGSYFSPWGLLTSSGATNDGDGSIAVTGLDLPSGSFTKKIYVNEAVSGGNNNGTSWANAFSKLQDAIVAATTENFCTTEIWVAKGTYYPDEENGQNTNNRSSSFIMRSGVKLYGGFAGGETNISLRNWFVNKTYLSGDLLQNNTDYENAQFLNYDDNAYHVVRGENTNSTSVLDGFYIQSGNANGTGEEDSGGGIYMSNSTMTVVNCEVSFNHAYQGSGIYLLTSSPLILNCYIKSNKAISGGAGVYNNTNSSGYFYNCVFHSNQVGTTTPAGGGGGAIINFNNSSPDYVNCTISGNDAKTGERFIT
jgi:hypothetical protein